MIEGIYRFFASPRCAKRFQTPRQGTDSEASALSLLLFHRVMVLGPIPHESIDATCKLVATTIVLRSVSLRSFVCF